MDLLGFSCAIFIGISLGLIGAGGSILTIPVLVYLFGVQPILATSYSLFVVGISASFACYSYFKQKLISIPTVFKFGIPSVIGIFFTRKYILHIIPENVIKASTIIITKDIFLMILLAVLMLTAAYLMIRPIEAKNSSHKANPLFYNYLIIFYGLMIGIIVGLVGAGGGFIIIPALVFLANLQMKNAIGTALAIIVLNSWFGFISDFGKYKFDWQFLSLFTLLAICGIFLGTYFSKFIPGDRLKPIFGWFVLIVGSFIVLKELIIK